MNNFFIPKGTFGIAYDTSEGNFVVLSTSKDLNFLERSDSKVTRLGDLWWDVLQIFRGNFITGMDNQISVTDIFAFEKDQWFLFIHQTKIRYEE